MDVIPESEFSDYELWDSILTGDGSVFSQFCGIID
jgi:hypothetical protein